MERLVHFQWKAVDTTGAGDSFVGALLTKIVDDQSVLQVTKISHFIQLTFTYICCQFWPISYKWVNLDCVS